MKKKGAKKPTLRRLVAMHEWRLDDGERNDREIEKRLSQQIHFLESEIASLQNEMVLKRKQYEFAFKQYVAEALPTFFYHFAEGIIQKMKNMPGGRGG